MFFQCARGLLIFTFALTFALEAHAVIEFGTGFNSATGGRVVPSLNLGVGSESFEVLFSSTGVSTAVYYSSSYTLGAYWTWDSGDFIFGKVSSGFGVGGIYGVHNFKDVGATEETKNDFAVGPAFFSRWHFCDPFYFSVEAIYGIGTDHLGDMLALNARDHVNFIFGVRL
jgi:hypothetical protein